MLNIGVDIVEIDRFRRIPYPDHKRFYDRTFSPREIEYCLFFGNPAQHFAATFAGKEAVYKALNQNLDIKLHEIEIVRDESGTPQVNLKTSLPIEVKVSLSHSSSLAVAFAIVRFPELTVKSG